jgi:N4-gp56 family major capsid protein
VANTYMGTAAIANQSAFTNLVQTGYDKYVEMALRSQPCMRSLCDKAPVNVTSAGVTYQLALYSTELSDATTPLTENVDPDAVALPTPGTVSLTVAEYGNVALLTEKLGFSSLTDIDPIAADLIAWNMLSTIDSLVLAQAVGGSNVLRPNARATTGAVTGTDIVSAALVRQVVAKMRTANAVPRVGSLYAAYIHPEVSYDLRAEATGGGFQDLHKYDASENFWPGFIGTFEGAFFVESPRMTQATDGATSTRVFRTVFSGKQFLAEAVALEPRVVAGPITDKLLRHRPIGWKGAVGFARYREAAGYRIESTSSIHNT